MTGQDFQPPYFPPPFTSAAPVPTAPHGQGAPAQPSPGPPIDYMAAAAAAAASDPYGQTLNSLHQHHYSQLSAAVTQRRDSDSIHVSILG